jgi:hypothetical protein
MPPPRAAPPQPPPRVASSRERKTVKEVDEHFNTISNGDKATVN